MDMPINKSMLGRRKFAPASQILSKLPQWAKRKLSQSPPRSSNSTNKQPRRENGFLCVVSAPLRLYRAFAPKNS